METRFKFIHFIENSIGLYEFESFFCFEETMTIMCIYIYIHIIATSRKDISSIEDIEVHQIGSVK